MKGERHPARLAVAEAREHVLARLSDAFAQDELGLEELEARVDSAYQATSELGLAALVKDLSASPAPVLARAELSTSAPLATAPRVLAVLGNVEIRTLPRGLALTAGAHEALPAKKAGSS